MGLTERTGDLFDQPDVGALAHGVNLRGAMGGLAGVVERRFPAAAAAYRAACASGELALGDALWTRDGDRWIVHLATQVDPGADARLDAVEGAVARLCRTAPDHGVARVALPRIGAGIGGLAWDHVREVLATVAEAHPVELVVVSLPDA
jgi:O-acetyl-ADP-ribose deacetylase (regulator of RNase III)